MRHKPPFQSAFLRWMGRDLEFESEDDAVAPLSSEPMNPLDDMSEFRPAAFKRKTTDDSIVVLSRRSRPRLQDNRRSDLFRRRYEKNGTTKGAGPSPSHYPVLISKNDDSLRGQVLSACRSSGQGDIPTLGLSAHQGQSPIISNVNHSPGKFGLFVYSESWMLMYPVCHQRRGCQESLPFLPTFVILG